MTCNNIINNTGHTERTECAKTTEMLHQHSHNKKNNKNTIVIM